MTFDALPATFDELPPYWQKRLRQQHAELLFLRDKQPVGVEGLPKSWQHEFARLRRGIAKIRLQRNEARAELEALRAQISAGK